MTVADQTRTPRSRRSTRPSGDDREHAILATAEKLLEERQLADISVDDLAKGAGISRPTFYFYFPSKEAVLRTLFERVIVAADAVMITAESPSADPVQSWRDGIYTFFESFRAHQAVALAGLAARATNAEIGELWSQFMQKWVAHIALVIEAERARGAAPVTIPAHELSAALNLMNERTMFATFAGEKPALAEDTSLDTLVHLWLTAIYGDVPR